jgi:hypothetical protein
LRSANERGRRADPRRPKSAFNEREAGARLRSELEAFAEEDEGDEVRALRQDLHRKLRGAEAVLAKLPGTDAQEAARRLGPVRAWAERRTRGTRLQRLTLAVARVYLATTGSYPGISREPVIRLDSKDTSRPAGGLFVELVQTAASALKLGEFSGEGIADALKWAKKHDVDLAEPRPRRDAPTSQEVFGEAMGKLGD